MKDIRNQVKCKVEASNKCSEERISVAEEVVNYASKIAEFSEFLQEKVIKKLNPIMKMSVPSVSAVEYNNEIEREYPPLFSDLRHNMRRIENCLEVIEDAMNRSEI